MSIIKGDFIDNLPKVYGLYTGGFVIFILLMALLELSLIHISEPTRRS